MEKKYLFISQSDLSLEDSNGRTLRDVLIILTGIRFTPFNQSKKQSIKC